jgi:hypothetical protein
MRLLAVLIILTLFLIPLLSTPAAAVVNYNAGSGTTINTIPPAPCTAVITMSAPLVVAPGALPPLIVTFSYTFIDMSAGPVGSSHVCTMVVTQTTPPGSPPGPWTATTGPTFLLPGVTNAGVLSLTINFPAAPRPMVYTVSVTMSVTDLNGPPPPPPRRGATAGPLTTTVTLL